MAAFKRGLSAEFVRALMSIAESEQSWWRDGPKHRQAPPAKPKERPTSKGRVHKGRTRA